jgi:putative FmdB family regulatory protein
MPLYEYRCTNCHHVFEKFHEVGGTPGPCPNCGGTPQRIFTSVGLIFKGSGFHTTDYRKRGAANGESPAPASGKESPKESSAKSEKGAGAVTKSDS